ncbi:MAG: bifunctional tRNA (5-methylaminomethyl-2-thiouridine)(34)-methyltransferase MnmD/FAD-dependent 5-carboxymethylaminomethyl-2-thiouridine(34) oxidoreductase MnmC [Zhongshania sp.]|uniref:bifunctional tRNA (5-methylaminomethyl-2-thiouridine)(34)-methyltransferase MnmD/FAD-dependent 5-carboxymethylaminomethyl-2-thiouridine(34) oxidoreductase MnmC n=1 Tax=Zhongshania sp. TaxID=1971902 RepID=UPI002604AF48|nr:bifunctional tRNA (5-methylaminomethyl-2-thiouridine)(34)-methyltransferase MnmD/FAD-dependent 5-carboxymethylaminomethyl-2-thiouridine(34) oxidoreductase MnmC [Zhongshania sp.]MDF1691053.1 bifunctional tRNA (5-methylaminomethyl-2-thiouridine)(34)-methyltransferase MnmD/FAD-dependent 5-carboxymethylaminomethyl-2-thiouridine(34) oxidoreductase MnmC [Zhongshania sp.]
MTTSQHDNPYSIHCANLQWGDDGAPRAADYGDIYFSQESGIDESRHVFLNHNNLAERWCALDRESTGRFTIIETGFGTGLNFLLAWQLWQQTAPQHWQLHYISVEKHPLKAEDLRRAQTSWPELASLAAILQYNYPPLLLGQHRRLLNSAQVCLDLLFGDALSCFPALLDAPNSVVAPEFNTNATNTPCADAWFLDGFSPATNPDMWHDDLFACIGALSKLGTTFATFTAAGFVKRGLRAQGFSVAKVRGFGRKRDMLQGTVTHSVASDAPRPAPVAVPWHRPAAQQPTKHIAIIGAGLAGCSTAMALAQRGYKVTVIERDTPASGASGNPQGILYTKLSADPGDLNQFTLASFLFSLAHYREQLDQKRVTGELCGVLQLAKTQKEISQFLKLKGILGDQDWLQFLSGDELHRCSGIALDGQGFFYRQAGWLSPPSVCAALLDHPNIKLVNHTSALRLEHSDLKWQILDEQQLCIVRADTVVIANSNDAKHFAQTAYLPLKSIRGQLSYLAEASLCQSPQCVICHEGYLAPPINGQLCVGASFDLLNKGNELRSADHDWNLEQLSALAPNLLQQDARPIGGRAALRCASPDYMPIVGAVPQLATFAENYKVLGKDARSKIPIAAANYPNLYVNVAHGSRGLTSTPLCAELLASYIANDIRPLPRHLCQALSPARFIIRKLIRKQAL